MLDNLSKLNAAIVALTATVTEYNHHLQALYKTEGAGDATGAGAETEKPPAKKKAAPRKKKAAKKETKKETETETETESGMADLDNAADPSMAGIDQSAAGHTPLDYATVRKEAQVALEQFGSIEIISELLQTEFKVEKLSAMDATQYPAFVTRLRELVHADKMPDTNDIL